MKTPEEWDAQFTLHPADSRHTMPATALFKAIQADARAELEQQLAELRRFNRGMADEISDYRQREAACYAALGAPCPSDEALPMLIERRMKEAKALVRELVECLEAIPISQRLNRPQIALSLKRANKFLSLVTGE